MVLCSDIGSPTERQHFYNRHFWQTQWWQIEKELKAISQKVWSLSISSITLPSSSSFLWLLNTNSSVVPVLLIPICAEGKTTLDWWWQWHWSYIQRRMGNNVAGISSLSVCTYCETKKTKKPAITTKNLGRTSDRKSRERWTEQSIKLPKHFCSK